MTSIAPIHPGEVLIQEFLDPLGSPSTTWPSPSAYPLGGSTRSCTVSVASPRTPPCAWPGTSPPPTGSGSTCRPGQTSSSRRTTSAAPWSRSSRYRAPESHVPRAIWAGVWTKPYRPVQLRRLTTPLVCLGRFGAGTRRAVRVRLRSGDSSGPTTADAGSAGPLGTLTPSITVIRVAPHALDYGHPRSPSRTVTGNTTTVRVSTRPPTWCPVTRLVNNGGARWGW